MPSNDKNTILTKDEHKIALCLRWRMEMPNMPKKYDSCGLNFTIEHAFACKKGSLIIAIDMII